MTTTTTPTTHARYLAALDRLVVLAPRIYTPARVAANKRAAERMDANQLLYFAEAAERLVKRKEANQKERS